MIRKKISQSTDRKHQGCQLLPWFSQDTVQFGGPGALWRSRRIGHATGEASAAGSDAKARSVGKGGRIQLGRSAQRLDSEVAGISRAGQAKGHDSRGETTWQIERPATGPVSRGSGSARRTRRRGKGQSPAKVGDGIGCAAHPAVTRERCTADSVSLETLPAVTFAIVVWSRVSIHRCARRPPDPRTRPTGRASVVRQGPRYPAPGE